MRAAIKLGPPWLGQEETGQSPVVTREEAQRRLGCGRRKIFELLKTGELVRGRRFGKKMVITLESLVRLEHERATGVTVGQRIQALSVD